VWVLVWGCGCGCGCVCGEEQACGLKYEGNAYLRIGPPALHAIVTAQPYPFVLLSCHAPTPCNHREE